MEQGEQTSKNYGTTSKDVTCMIGIQEKKRKRMDHKKYFEVIVAENFPKLMTGTKHPQEVQRTQSRKYTKYIYPHPQSYNILITENQRQRENIKEIYICIKNTKKLKK